MIDAAERDGLLGGERRHLVEATAGNTGLGLALVGAQRGYQLTLVIPDKMSQSATRPTRSPMRRPPARGRIDAMVWGGVGSGGTITGLSRFFGAERKLADWQPAPPDPNHTSIACTEQLRHGSKEWTIRSNSMGSSNRVTRVPINACSIGPGVPRSSAGEAFQHVGVTIW